MNAVLLILSAFVLCFYCICANASDVACEDGSDSCIKSSGNSNKIPEGANKEGKPKDVELSDCHDRSISCPTFAASGECNKNPGWMTVNCPISCNACHLLDPQVRCDRVRLNVSTEPVIRPNDINTIFTRIVDRYSVTYNVTVLSQDPWIVTLDNFMSKKEISALLKEVDGKWERSTDTGKRNAYGEVGRVVSEKRTSSNAWCRNNCEANPDVGNIIKKIESVTTVPEGNFESFQVLRYELGQKYQAHHDSSESQNKLPAGLRILTFFLYLSDVEEGGETAFPHLDIAVKPKQGSALLWSNVINDNPSMPDSRTLHEARPVIKGEKYAANTWIHLYNFKVPNHEGCTGAFEYTSK